MATFTPTWFATHGRKDELSFLAFEQERPALLLVVLAGEDGRTSWETRESAIQWLWPAIRGAFPDWRGQRPTLGELWFFAPNIIEARDALVPALRNAARICDVRAVAFRVAGEARARLRGLNAICRALMADAPCQDPEEAWRIVNGEGR